MLGRRNYSPEQLNHAKEPVERQLESHRTLVKAVGEENLPQVFEPLFLTT